MNYSIFFKFSSISVSEIAVLLVLLHYCIFYKVMVQLFNKGITFNSLLIQLYNTTCLSPQSRRYAVSITPVRHEYHCITLNTSTTTQHTVLALADQINSNDETFT